MTIVLNRRVPFAPEQLEGGRNGNGDMVDLQWRGNTECDVLGYHVYRSTTGAAGSWDPGHLPRPGGLLSRGHELRRRPGAHGRPALVLRRGASTSTLGRHAPQRRRQHRAAGDSGNTVPSQPTNLTACLGGTPGCVEPDGTPRPPTARPRSPGTRARTPDGDHPLLPDLPRRQLRRRFTLTRVGRVLPLRARRSAHLDRSGHAERPAHLRGQRGRHPFFGESQLSAPVVNFP